MKLQISDLLPWHFQGQNAEQRLTCLHAEPPVPQAEIPADNKASKKPVKDSGRRRPPQLNPGPRMEGQVLLLGLLEIAMCMSRPFLEEREVKKERKQTH